MNTSKVYLEKSPLFEILSTLLPTPEQTVLLRACLWPGEPGRQAWTEWCEYVGDPIDLLKNGNETLKGLLPLIFAALRENGLDIGETLKTCLHTATLREELRMNAYSRILGQVLSTLADKHIPAIVLEGAALADTVYESPALRHSGKIQLLIKGTDLFRVAELIHLMGFSELSEQGHSEFKQINLRHDSGLPLHLNSSLFPVPYYNVPLNDLWSRSQVQHIAEVPTRILSPTDNLLHTCGNAFLSPSRKTLLWVFDNWFIINKYPNLNWNELLETARRSHLELPLSVTLGYLAEQLNATIPSLFLKNLYAAAFKTDTEGPSHALFVMREEMGKNYIKMFLLGGNWRTRSYLASWIIRSPISHMRWFWLNYYPRLFLARVLSVTLRGLARRMRLLKLIEK